MRNWPKYPNRGRISLEEFEKRVGGEPFASDWLATDQAMFDGFADATGDDAFIHTDPVAAAGTRFGGTIAHGLLTLSLLPFMLRSAVPLLANARMGVNYGYDRVRFLTPVPCGARVRGIFALTGIERKDGGFAILHYDVAVEIEGKDKPALSAQWLLGQWIRGGNG